MAKGSSGEPNKGWDEMTFVAMFVVIALAIWLVWTKFRHVIVYALFGMDWLQYETMHLLGLLGPHGEQMLSLVSFYLTSQPGFDPHTISMDELMGTQADVGHRVRWALTLVIAAMGVWCAFRMKGDGFRRTYSLSGREQSRTFYFLGVKIGAGLLQNVLRLLTTYTLTKRFLVREKTEWVSKGVSFMHYQSKHWRVALAGAHFDPDAQDEQQEPAKTPMEWMRDCGVKLNKREGLDEDAAEKAFARQLGPAWQGIEKAATHVQALCILAALNFKRGKGQANEKQVDKLRDSFTEAYILSPENADTLVKATLKPYLADRKLCEGINRLGAKHAFTNTAVIGIIGFCGPFREWGGGDAGVIASAMFRWLKKIDRPLWYCFNNLGRRAYHVEGAGGVSHFFAERVVGGLLAEPYMDCAVDGLATYIEDHGIVDLDEFFRVKKDF